jgi:hypothetical protein
MRPGEVWERSAPERTQAVVTWWQVVEAGGPGSPVTLQRLDADESPMHGQVLRLPEAPRRHWRRLHAAPAG